MHLGVDAGQTLRPVDARQFGLNTATWDGSLGDSQTLPLLQQIGCKVPCVGRAVQRRMGYHWASDPAGNATFQTLATNLGAQVFTTINYGTGTPSEAAAWVLMANQTNHCGFKYWEIGNECYGSWETDTHAIPHDPYTYATNAVVCIQQMKAAYPAVPIKIGVVVVPGEGSYANNTSHYAINPRTGTTNYGWTPVVLSVMKSLGVTPDFLIYHFYPQYTTAGWTYYSGSPDSDPLLLQVAENPSPLNWSDWASAAADLRQQITDYIGTDGSNIELCVTENNSDAGAMGRQSTSLVNALYLADSTSALMKTEFRSYVWWDLHNGYETDGNFDPTIYGWRPNGDYGILSGGQLSRIPPFTRSSCCKRFRSTRRRRAGCVQRQPAAVGLCRPSDQRHAHASRHQQEHDHESHRAGRADEFHALVHRFVGVLWHPIRSGGADKWRRGITGSGGRELSFGGGKL